LRSSTEKVNALLNCGKEEKKEGNTVSIRHDFIGKKVNSRHLNMRCSKGQMGPFFYEKKKKSVNQ